MCCNESFIPIHDLVWGQFNENFTFILLYFFILINLRKKNLFRREIPFSDWYNLDDNTGTACLYC